jgi:small subunit ribosomal protein S8
MMTDPIADMLTRIRNAIRIERAFVDVPLSQEKKGIAGALQREGYIWDFEVVGEAPHASLRLNLKYGPNGERLIQSIKRVSKPGRRVYCRSTELPNVLQGLGVCIVSTSKGIMSNREARQQGVGGEVLCELY